MSTVCKVNRPLVQLLGLCCLIINTSLVASTQISSSADPVVSGNTITVDNDGWYQFQRADDFTQLCAGTFECTVPPGAYIVINHTTGQRWDPVIVSESIATEIQVSGNRIVVPDDGWYQVQDRQSYASICEGTRSCDVPTGSYIVINHTTGQRFEPIMVPNDVSEKMAISGFEGVRYSVSAAELFWNRIESDTSVVYDVLRDGVQIGQTSGNSYFDNTLEEGNTYEYRVEAGQSAASEQIILPVFGLEDNPDIDDPPSPADALLTASNAEAILKQVISVINEDHIDAMFEKAQADMKFQDRLFFLSNTTDEIQFSQGIDLDTPYQMETNYETGVFTAIPVRREYTCAKGGSIYNYFNDRVFNDCAVGENTYNGTIGRRNDRMRGVISSYPFYDFSVTDTTGITSTLSGGYYIGNQSFVVLNQSKGWRNASFNTTTPAGPLSITEFNVARDDDTGRESTFALTDDGVTVAINIRSWASTISGFFVVTAPWSDDQPLFVEVLLGFSTTERMPADSEVTDIPGGISTRAAFQWQTGSIDVSANDGSSFSARPSSSLSNELVIEFDDGERIEPIPWSGDYTVDCGSSQVCPEQ